MNVAAIAKDGVAPFSWIEDELLLCAMSRALRPLLLAEIEIRARRALAYMRAGLAPDPESDKRLAALDARALAIARHDPLRGHTTQRHAA